MKFLVLLTPVAGKTLTDFQPHMKPEIEAIWRSYASGDLREFYFCPEPQIVTLIYELPDMMAVNRALDALPMIEAGLLERRVVPLGPFLQFEHLFAPEGVGA
jgi:hypothetical protein